MNRPALTAVAVRGMDWVRTHAAADLEAALSDEIPSLSDKRASEVAAALRYLANIESWYHHHHPDDDPPIDEQDRALFEDGLP